VIGIADGRALGASIRVVVTDRRRLAAAKAAVDRVLRAIDDACSRFRDDSELTMLNNAAGGERRVSPLLGHALAVALRAAHETGGAVDPTVGTAIKKIGYVGDFDVMARDGAHIELKVTPVPGWRAVQLSEVHGTVFLPKRVEIDLGSTAKALAADLAAASALEATGGCGVLVSLGGDVAVAGEPPTGGWQIQISEDSAAPIDDEAESVMVTSGGVATSSTTVRRWTRGEIALHHIIDPSTGLSAAGPWRTVTVAARDCVAANTAATAAIVLGHGAIEWIETRGLSARLVSHQGDVVRAGSWPASIHSNL